jgi:hypothetical protein
MNASTGSAPYPTIRFVEWDTKTNIPITFSGSGKITYVGLDNSANVVQQLSPWGTTDINQWDTQINLGVVLHLSGNVSTGVFNSPQISYGLPQKTDDFFRAFGPLKVSGHTLQASGSSPTLSIKKTGGTSFREGANYATNPNHPSTVIENDITVSKIYRYHISGSTPVIDTGVGGAGYTTIDNTQYVNTTTGALTSIGTGNWSIQRVFWIPNSPTNAFIVYYGNASYSSLLNAVNAKDTEPFTEAPNTAANAIFLGFIIVEGGASPPKDLLAATNTIIPAGLFRSVGGVGASGTSPVATALASLSDVSVSGLAAGDLLVYNGATWNNTKSLNGAYSLSGSLATNDGITAVTINATSISSSLSGSGAGVFGVNYNTLSNIPSGIVSSSTQVKTLLPDGTVSSSAQYPAGIVSSSAQFPGWVTSSTQIDYNSIQNKLSGVISSSTQFNALTGTSASYALTASYVEGAASDWASLANKPADLVSSSTQVKAFLPGGTVSSSAQYPGWVTSSAQVNSGSFTGSFTGSILSAGVVSSSAQIVAALPIGTVSSSAQYPGWVTSSAQIVWSSVNYSSGIASSSAQVKALLPGGTVTSSAQFPGWVTASSQIVVQNTTGIGALATTGSNTFIGNQVISGSLTTTADTMTFNGSMAVSGTLSVTGSLNTINGGLTGSLLGTSSWASNAISSSFATTASYALNAQSGGTGAGFPFSGSAIITGSLEVVNTGSVGGITGSFKGDGSQLTNLPVATILSSSVAIDTYTFSGDGSVKNYVLSQSYDIDSLIVSLDGLTQIKTTDYTLAGATLSFVDTPPSASNILVRAFLNVTQNMTGSFSGSFLGIVSTASFASAINRQISGNVGITGSLDVTGPVSLSGDLFVGGYLTADKLLVSSSVIYESGSTKFGDSPDDTHQFTGSVSFTQVPNIRLQADNHLFIGDGTTTIYTLSSSYDPSILTVSVDGMLNALTSDYSVSTNQLTFVSAPPSESNVFVKGLRITLS